MAEAPSRKFLIIRLGSLGDLVHTIPAAAALRRAFPQAKIDWVVEQRWSPLIQMVTCVDEVIPLRRTLSGQLDCIRQLRRAHYQCAIDFQGLYKSALLAWFAGAPQRIGRNRQAARETGAAWFYTDGVSPQGRHVAEMSLSLAARAGALPGEMQFPLRVPSAASDDFIAKLSKDGIPTYIVVSPGGGWRSKCWPAARYGALCDELWRRRGLRAVVNAGPGEEQLAQEVVDAAGAAKPLVLSPSLLELAALLAKAQLVVAADTGPLHLAAALGAPVVALFGPTDEARNGPLPRGRVIRRASSVSSTAAPAEAEAPNSQRGDYTRGNDYSKEMLGLSVEQVLAAAEEEMSVKA